MHTPLPTTHTAMRMQKVLALLVLCLAGHHASGQGWFECPKPPVQSNFELKRYTGLWYEIERYWYMVPELNTYCGTAQYTIKNDSHILVNNSARTGSVNADTYSVIGDAYAPNPSEPAKLIVSFGSPAPLWILETDYVTYSIAFSCTEVLGAVPIQFAWIISRDANFADTPLFEKVRDRALSYYKLPDYFERSVQKGCW